MIQPIKEFNNGIEDCLTIKSDNNKYIKDKINNELYDICDIVKNRLSEYEETDKEIEINE